MLIGRTDTDREVYVIAEVGGNHNGDAGVALRLVEAAAAAGANAVKFQTYRAETLVHPDLEAMPLAAKHYRRQFDRFKSLELSWDVYEVIIARCAELEIDFLTTPFDIQALEQMADFMPAIKIASGDLTFHPLIESAVATGKPVILSTGMADAEEIRGAAALIPATQRVLLHCVSMYPLPGEKANLRAIPALAEAIGETVVGYSDHSIGIEAPLAATALGARVIEKHFTLDNSQELGDHRLSIEPAELKSMVEAIRRIAAMLGSGEIGLTDGELPMRRMLRRGIYAARNLPAGTVISADDLVYLRPETGLTPASAGQLVGHRTANAIPAMAAMEKVSAAAKG